MAETRLRSTEEIREEQRRQDSTFRAYWERTALARAVALALIGYRVKHHLTQTQLAQMLGVRQPQVARSEMGEHNPSLEILQRLARALGLRFIIEVARAGEGAPQDQLDAPLRRGGRRGRDRQRQPRAGGDGLALTYRMRWRGWSLSPDSV